MSIAKGACRMYK